MHTDRVLRICADSAYQAGFLFGQAFGGRLEWPWPDR